MFIIKTSHLSLLSFSLFNFIILILSTINSHTNTIEFIIINSINNMLLTVFFLSFMICYIKNIQVYNNKNSVLIILIYYVTFTISNNILYIKLATNYTSNHGLVIISSLWYFFTSMLIYLILLANNRNVEITDRPNNQYIEIIENEQ